MCSSDLEVVLTTEGSEAPVLGDNDLLATGELVLRAAEGLEGESTVCGNDQLAAPILAFGSRPEKMDVTYWSHECERS